MECLWIKVLGMLIIHVSSKVDSQCSPESGKSQNIKGHKKSNCFYYKLLFSTEMYLMLYNTCYGNNTVFNKEDIGSSADSGITQAVLEKEVFLQQVH